MADPEVLSSEDTAKSKQVKNKNYTVEKEKREVEQNILRQKILI